MLVERVFRDKTVDKDGATLPDTVGTGDGLLLGGLVPPGVKQEDIVGGGEVESYAARLERYEEELAVGGLLEVGNRLLALPCLACQHVVLPTSLLHLVAYLL